VPSLTGNRVAQWALRVFRDVNRRLIGVYIILVFYIVPRRTIRGISVRIWPRDYSDTDRYWQLVGEALSMIERVDPRRFARLQRDLRCIFVRPIFFGDAVAPLGFYWRRFRTCVLNADRFPASRYNTTEVAVVIVHEAIHARLPNSRSRLDSPRWRREEALCIREQVAFSRLLPDGAQYIAVAEQAWATLGLE
jgi:hypothetical protein